MQDAAPIVIPAYKRPDQLARCLEAINAQTVPCAPLVVDNSEHNIGFTAAVNRGIREAMSVGAEFVVSLNQDCYLKPDAIENVLKFMERKPACAVAGIKQLSAADPDLIVHGGCTVAYPLGAHHVGRVSRGDHSVSLPMPWVNGACQVFRSAALAEFGLLDEGMFLIGSDSDICYTARLRGWECWYCAEAECIHDEGGVSRAPSPGTSERMRADMLYWQRKWVSGEAYRKLKAV